MSILIQTNIISIPLLIIICIPPFNYNLQVREIVSPVRYDQQNLVQ
jgi:hypothetical protein